MLDLVTLEECLMHIFLISVTRVFNEGNMSLGLQD